MAGRGTWALNMRAKDCSRGGTASASSLAGRRGGEGRGAGVPVGEPVAGSMRLVDASGTGPPEGRRVALKVRAITGPPLPLL
jgi:hypothetical protein